MPPPAPVASLVLIETTLPTPGARATRPEPESGVALPLPKPKPMAMSGALSAPAPELPVIAIDPGHGGRDAGARGVRGTREKDVNLRMALDLRQRLLATGRYRVVMTRDDDTYVALRDRLATARLAGASLLISLHADSIRTGRPGMPVARGASVYTLSEDASDDEAARLARSENKADIIAGTDLSTQDTVVQNILIDLALRDATNRSIAFADMLVEELRGTTDLVNRTRRFAGFVVLKSPDVPAVLLEMGYLSNAEEEKAFASAARRAGMTAAILRALDRYFMRVPP